ncbi:MAG: hypothetical protein ACKVVT_01810 [Dehalococcoidia bacterium]
MRPLAPRIQRPTPLPHFDPRPAMRQFVRQLQPALRHRQASHQVLNQLVR